MLGAILTFVSYAVVVVAGFVGGFVLGNLFGYQTKENQIQKRVIADALSQMTPGGIEEMVEDVEDEQKTSDRGIV